MKYKDMEEIKITQWDGKPFKAYVTDFDNSTCDYVEITVTGFNNGAWVVMGSQYDHAYPVEWNKPKPKRMTNRQLSMWHAQGNGEYMLINGLSVWSCFSYPKGTDNEDVPKDVRVRIWGSDDWVEPTVDLLKGDN